MTLYLDASAFLTVYLEEPQAPAFERVLAGDPEWLTGRHTRIEVRRNLTRVFRGRTLTDAREQFEGDWRRTSIVELDADLCERAMAIAEETRVRTLDALHLAAAGRVMGAVMVTHDRGLARAARSLGLDVARV